MFSGLREHEVRRRRRYHENDTYNVLFVRKIKKGRQTMDLFQFIEKATSRFHTIRATKEELVAANFTELSSEARWDLQRGGKYYVEHDAAQLIAFTLGNGFTAKDSIRVTAAHGDFPALSIKTNPEVVKEGYLQLNVEAYGGVNLMSWLDVPLSIAGRVITRSEDVFHPHVHLVDFEKPVLIIPNIAIHLTRNMNEGMKLNKQVHMLPILAMTKEKEEVGFLNRQLAKKLGVEETDILDYELTLYNPDKGCLVGFHEEFLSAPRLDDLSSVKACLDALLQGGRESGINIFGVYDHEEIGSKTKTGAGSVVLASILEKIYISLGYDAIDYQNAWKRSMFMSVDVGHAFHPNFADKYDITNKDVLNKGFTIKEAVSQSYATDSEAIAIVQQICDKENIPYQKSVNRSDMSGGSTLGCIASTMTPMRVVDLGLPLLAMHSIREMGGVKDLEALTRYLIAYYSLS